MKKLMSCLTETHVPSIFIISESIIKTLMAAVYKDMT